MPDSAERVRAYYRALDGGAYDRLTDLLAPDFVQERPDRTLAGRDRFVSFMREERPQSDTRHAVDAVFEQHDGDGIAVRGRLLTAEGAELAAFVDVFDVGDGQIRRLDTYTA
jgi:ketosteroid isomerase-like protein